MKRIKRNDIFAQKIKFNYLDIWISPINVTLTKPFFEKISLNIF